MAAFSTSAPPPPSSPASPIPTVAPGARLRRSPRSVGGGGAPPKTTANATTAEEAVNNILYNTPDANEPEDKCFLSVLVDNEPGVLSKVSGLLSARGFNIDSLSVSATDVRDLSRMYIVLRGAPAAMVQARRQLEDLVNVWAVIDYTKKNVLERELAMVKVAAVPPSFEALSSKGGVVGSYEEIMSSHFHRQGVMDLAKMFNAQVEDVGSEHMILLLCSWPRRVDAFIRMLKPFGIVEAARSGCILMPRSPVLPSTDPNARAAAAAVDLASLPPS